MALFDTWVSHFEILKQISQLMAQNKEYRGYAEYATLRAKGLRKESLQVLNEFIQQLLKADVATQRDFVQLLCQQKLRYRENGGDMWLDPQPLVIKVMEPVLEQWIKDEPQNPEPYRWKGVFYPDEDIPQPLEKALELDPTDRIAAEALIYYLLDQLEGGGRYLDESDYAGDPATNLEHCRLIRTLVENLQDEDVKRAILQETDEYELAIQDWIAYKKSASTLTFPEYSESMGHTHSYVKKYYYRED